ncbi:hypothetical protein PA08_2172 [Cutibacterium modestum P08]|nr:hypothetical protein PA08_2172 [Cutibacterium modestum P08]
MNLGDQNPASPMPAAPTCLLTGRDGSFYNRPAWSHCLRLCTVAWLTAGDENRRTAQNDRPKTNTILGRS